MKRCIFLDTSGRESVFQMSNRLFLQEGVQEKSKKESTGFEKHCSEAESGEAIKCRRGVHYGDEFRFFLVFFGCFFARSLDIFGGGDSRKAECDGLGELEIVFDAVVMGEGTRLFWCSLERLCVREGVWWRVVRHSRCFEVWRLVARWG